MISAAKQFRYLFSNSGPVVFSNLPLISKRRYRKIREGVKFAKNQSTLQFYDLLRRSTSPEIPFSDVQNLNMYRAKLRYIPQVGHLHNLITLDLRGNALLAVPSTFSLFTQLTNLDLSHNISKRTCASLQITTA